MLGDAAPIDGCNIVVENLSNSGTSADSCTELFVELLIATHGID